MTNSTPAEGIRILTLPDPEGRFKTAMLTVQLLLPLSADRAAEQAILPFLLRRGSAAYPDFSALKRRLDRLYGAAVSAGVQRLAECQALRLQVTCLDDRFALNGESVAAECAELLREMLFEPALENGLFRTADIEEERRCLIEDIRAEINNKRGYARTGCERLICEGEPYAVPATGTEEAVAALTAEQITAAWRRVLSEARVLLIYQGNGDGEAVAAPFIKGFASVERHPLPLTVTHLPFEGVPAEKEEPLPVNQSKLVLGFKYRLPREKQDPAALRMAASLLGGTAFSMLFSDVREKLSLCYYCSVTLDRLKGVALIDSGLDADKLTEARAAIFREVERLSAGDFSDELMEDTRRFLLSQYGTVNDLQSSRAAWYMNRAFTERYLTPEEEGAELTTVTRERVMAAAREFVFAGEYRLIPNGEGGNEDE